MKSYVIDSRWGKFVISAELTPDQAWEFTKVLGCLAATAEGGGE